MTDEEIEEIRRKVAQEYHRVMIDLAMTGKATMPIVKEGGSFVREFRKDENNVIVYADVAADDSGEAQVS